jgi:hypothetical protein
MMQKRKTKIKPKFSCHNALSAVLLKIPLFVSVSKTIPNEMVIEPEKVGVVPPIPTDKSRLYEFDVFLFIILFIWDIFCDLFSISNN